MCGVLLCFGGGFVDSFNLFIDRARNQDIPILFFQFCSFAQQIRSAKPSLSRATPSSYLSLLPNKNPSNSVISISYHRRHTLPYEVLP